MKKILNKIVVTIVFIVFAAACKKAATSTDNPFVDINNLGTGSYITLNSVVNANLNFALINTSKVSVKVDAYANNIGKIKEIKLYVYKGSSADPKAWKFVKTVPFSGTTELGATGAEIATAYGTTTGALFSPGQVYTFYNQIITEDGKIYDLSNIGQALESSSNYNSCFRWSAFVVCPFTGGMAGTYKVIQDDWVDWNPGDLVQVTDGPAANQVNISQVWPGVPAGGTIVNPLIVKVDPLTGSATIPSTIFGNYGGSTNYIAVGSGSGANAGYIFSCTGYIGLSMNLTSSGGSNFGANKLILQKQ